MQQMTESIRDIGNVATLPNAVKQTAAVEKPVCFLCGSEMEAIVTGLTDNRWGHRGRMKSGDVFIVA
jgi:hypothetical protein